VAALRTVLDLQFDIDISEHVLAAFGATQDTELRDEGSSNQDLKRIMREVIYRYPIHSGTVVRLLHNQTIKDIAEWLVDGIYPIATTKQKYKGHHVRVVIGVGPGRIRYFDPAQMRPRTVSIEEFERDWDNDLEVVVTKG